MTRHRSFTTASARRKENPIVWEINQTIVRLKATVDLADMAELIDYLQADQTDTSFMKYAVEKRARLADMITKFVVDEDKDRFSALKNELDIGTIVEMVQDLIAEYAGTGNPTQPSSSFPGSDPTGQTSTVGAPAEASTQSISPQIAQ